MLAQDEKSNIETEESNIKEETEQFGSQQYKMLIQAKDQQIALLTQEIKYRNLENEKLLEMIKTITQNSGSIYINDSRVDVLNIDSQNKNIYESQDLSQAAKDIQTLLEQLEKDYHSDTVSEKMIIATKAIEHIENDNKLANKVFKALEKGDIQNLQNHLDNPVVSFLIAALKDWQKNKR